MTNQDEVVRMKSRGRLSLVASVGLIFGVFALWLYINVAMAAHGALNPANDTLMGEIFTTFAMVIGCGILGVANAVMQIRSGRRSATLTFLTIVCLFAAIVTGALASL